MTFQQKLKKIIEKNNSLVCVGLDPVLEKLPKEFLKRQYPFFSFNTFIIDSTHDLVCCYKPNTAFYEALGAQGIGELKKTCDYLRKKYPEIPILLDAKRGDIGNTNTGYTKFAFDYVGADGITLHPYLGKDSLEPFLQQKDKGLFILCHTTNAGAGEIQDIQVSGKPLYKIIAQKVIHEWNTHNNCMLVLGAAYPQQLAQIRKMAGEMTFLVPGIGSQGGDIQKVVQAGLNSQNMGLLINSSRGIIFAKNPRENAEKLRSEINQYRL